MNTVLNAKTDCPLTTRFIETNGVRLHAVEAGPETGSLAILLHGFPEFWFGWRAQIEPLARAGVRVLAPDQRGYNLSAKPRGLDAYRIDALADDVIGLIDGAGRKRVHLVGHDWGAAVAWRVAARAPERLHSLSILNVPHPNVMMKTLRTDPRQLLKSWYIFFFQLPWLPEAGARAFNWQAGTNALRGSSRRGTFSAADLTHYRVAWSQPGAFTAMINWYRAIIQRPPARLQDSRIHVPTQILWGKRDQFLTPEMAAASVELCDDATLTYFDRATHWVQHEEAEAVNEKLLEFWKRNR